MNKEEVNLLEHVYDKGQMTEFPGEVIYALMQVLSQVRDSEKMFGFTTSYVKSSKEVFDKKRTMQDGSKFLNAVEQEFEVYPTAESWFNQKPQEMTSMLGATAMDLLMLLQNIHLENIEKGIAKPVGTFEKPKNEEAIKVS